MEDLKATLTKYWWAIAAAVVLWMTMGTKKKRTRSKARLRRGRMRLRTMRSRYGRR